MKVKSLSVRLDYEGEDLHETQHTDLDSASNMLLRIADDSARVVWTRVLPVSELPEALRAIATRTDFGSFMA